MLISRGNPVLKGCIKIRDSYYFTFSCPESDVKLLLYADGQSEPEVIELTTEYKTGDIFAVCISRINLDKYLYCYEVCGCKVIDPYAKTISNCAVFGEYEEETLYLSRVVLSPYKWDGDVPLEIPYDESIFYKCSVRGLTKSSTSHVRHKGTFKGLTEKLNYIKELGVTSLLLMPSYEYDEIGRFHQLYTNGYGKYASGPIKGRVNYWGYGVGFYFAPKSSFTSVSAVKSDYTTEFKDMVKKFHKAGIEIIMEMHFHGETTDFILDCMHYWVLEYHIDGFYLYADEASLDAASKDPLLSKTKIIMVRFNGEKKLYKNIANYNSDFMNVARKFLKGDENQLRDFVRVSRNNPPQNANINYITSHDGFTLMDLVSFERRHNEYNGSINLDGENFNNSWNCGAEGETKKRHILQLRKRQMKNAFMLLFLSQGTPLLLAGDECCNSQDGNNNPYCIDSELSWVNWKNRGMAKEMTDFVKELIAFRKKYKILHMPEQLHAYDVLECGFPDVSTHGDSAWYDAMESFNRHIGIMYYNRYSCEDTDKNVFIYIAYNMHWEKHMLALPKIDDSCKWEAVISSGTKESAVIQPDNRSVEVEPRCIVVLTCSIKEKADRKRVNKGIEKNEYQ